MADVVTDLKKLIAVVNSLETREAKVKETLAKQIKVLDGLKDPKVLITGLVKTYMNSVRDTDGLTSVRPATLKAIQTAEKDPSKAAKAIAELKAHAADLKKEKDKKAKLFEKKIDDIISKLNALV